MQIDAHWRICVKICAYMLEYARLISASLRIYRNRMAIPIAHTHHSRSRSKTSAQNPASHRLLENVCQSVMHYPPYIVHKLIIMGGPQKAKQPSWLVDDKLIFWANPSICFSNICIYASHTHSTLKLHLQSVHGHAELWSMENKLVPASFGLAAHYLRTGCALQN